MYLRKTLLMHRHCYRPLELESALELTMWRSFQPFNRHYGNSGRWLLTQPESNKPLNQAPRSWKRHWDLEINLSSPSGKALARLFFLLPQLSRCLQLIPGCTTLKLRSGTLTKTKQCHLTSLSSMLLPLTFQMGLTIDMGLLLLTPNVPSLPFDPQDNAFLSWAHSYAAFHNRSNCWVCGVLPSSSVEGFPWWVFPFQGKDFLQLCENIFTNNNHMWCLSLIWWHLAILKWTGVTLCTLTMAIMWLSTLIVQHLDLMSILLNIKKVNGSRSHGFLPNVYQIWDEVIWLTPEKGRLLPNAPKRWEQIEPSPEVSWQLN